MAHPSDKANQCGSSPEWNETGSNSNVIYGSNVTMNISYASQCPPMEQASQLLTQGNCGNINGVNAEHAQVNGAACSWDAALEKHNEMAKQLNQFQSVKRDRKLSPVVADGGWGSRDMNMEREKSAISHIDSNNTDLLEGLCVDDIENINKAIMNWQRSSEADPKESINVQSPKPEVTASRLAPVFTLVDRNYDEQLSKVDDLEGQETAVQQKNITSNERDSGSQPDGLLTATRKNHPGNFLHHMINNHTKTVNYNWFLKSVVQDRFNPLFF